MTSIYLSLITNQQKNAANRNEATIVSKQERVTTIYLLYHNAHCMLIANFSVILFL